MLNPPPVPELLADLERFQRLVAELVADPRCDWSWRPAAGEWSLTEVACHLRDVELEVHRPRLSAMLGEGEPFLAGVESDEWAIARGYRFQDGPAAAEAFAAARAATLALLEGLSPASWERRGQHTFFGPTSLHELVNLAAQHDRIHEQQIARLLARST